MELELVVLLLVVVLMTFVSSQNNRKRTAKQARFCPRHKVAESEPHIN
jgi:hypothetical protein